MTPNTRTIGAIRAEYHRRICADIIRISKGETGIEYPNFADGSNPTSRKLAWQIVEQLNYPRNTKDVKGQTAGAYFETITKDFIQKVFDKLIHIRPGNWIYSTQTRISEYEQYEHLSYLDDVIRRDKKLESALRGGYIVMPDIVVGRKPVSDESINTNGIMISENEVAANLTPLRQANRNPQAKILHASISCKWTIRSDRAQNTRTEALNLIRNRKGPLPHIVAVTAEPTPHRLASLALGTGDLDCVYHFALYELIQAAKYLNLEDTYAEIQMMVDGKRLRDISDLPFDLAI
jgi:hypothetical protein